MMQASRMNIILIMLSAFLAVACSSTRSQYYVLDSIAAQKPAVEAASSLSLSSIAITQLEIPNYLDRPHMVSRDAGNQLQIAEYDQWGGRLRDNIARTLADDLAARLPHVTVSAAPMPGSMDAEVQLLVDIRQFERLHDGRVHLKLQWHVRHAQQEKMQSHLEHLQSEQSIGAGDYDAIAAAMSQLLAQLAENMADTLLKERQ
ncbi:MAG: hypothetical protein CO186_11035 [Zetaproteobacteria bacterium CG_4_9_14_3_um_filter_49_83]|nr:MAG: hypothetical protein AUJ56_08790 [Zetaproteobacteria bacterium CG1_02_49_23]PIQ32110.1 MAG: hypothetical protein COW62_08230 [Zetaproteobacteria bacterium CG17_big_fil_post_rev_8_21_14_2_50_50_13]PIV31427.1 MAG: hypothetical protein COS35_01445 [Zetaproteobacteria bacterium CG02_land_8_20_14_3_00_50_9]PIY54758.1 MAG: hypothetical protein COZ00_13010 [Zetaproteobacteria bacterium CG_4_10_14_0_8_um_filter_49_80]PJA34320.1 MAG: hypothetical protein CO186_11035 [Zetaproteobacteria bacterium